MKIVIDISKELFERIKETNPDSCATFTESALVELIQKGEFVEQGADNEYFTET